MAIQPTPKARLFVQDMKSKWNEVSVTEIEVTFRIESADDDFYKVLNDSWANTKAMDIRIVSEDAT